MIADVVCQFLEIFFLEDGSGLHQVSRPVAVHWPGGASFQSANLRKFSDVRRADFASLGLELRLKLLHSSLTTEVRCLGAAYLIVGVDPRRRLDGRNAKDLLHCVLTIKFSFLTTCITARAMLYDNRSTAMTSQG
jgi:hypothetical protein